jgi:hypothetical protein
MATEILEEVYELVADGNTDSALDVIFDTVDDLLEGMKDTECDALLNAVDVARLDVATMLGFLSTTAHAREALKARASYVSRVRLQLRSTLPETEVSELLDRLA